MVNIDVLSGASNISTYFDLSRIFLDFQWTKYLFILYSSFVLTVVHRVSHSVLAFLV